MGLRSPGLERQAKDAFTEYHDAIRRQKKAHLEAPSPPIQTFSQSDITFSVPLGPAAVAPVPDEDG